MAAEPQQAIPWDGHPPSRLISATQYHWLGLMWKDDGIAWVEAFHYDRKTNCWRGVNVNEGGSVEAAEIADHYVYVGPIDWPVGFEDSGRSTHPG